MTFIIEKGKRRVPRTVVAMSLVGVALLSGACSFDDVLGTGDLPPEVSDPKVTETAAGARAAYQGALARLRKAYGSYGGGAGGFVAISGLLADELEYGGSSWVDRRHLPEAAISGTDAALVRDAYGGLHQVRGQTAQAIGLLSRFAPGSEALVGHMYAVQGYAEIFLADLFCSGVPLSTLDYGGDYTYRPGSTTEEIYESALARFEAARPLVTDSARLANLTRVGRARALLALGRFADAAAAVSEVPDAFRYEIGYSAEAGMYNFARMVSWSTGGPLERWDFTVGDREGTNGLDFASSGDPRVDVATFPPNGRGIPTRVPRKYTADGSTPILMASGIEARLIEAEAALHASDVASWLGTLNRLRQTAWPSIVPAVTSPLPLLEDPGTPEARVDLLFRERAFWLFLTGHRQGDLRRLLRQYDRRSDEVYPIGSYLGMIGFGQVEDYGTYVNLPVPLEENTLNPHFTGCASRGA